MFTFRRTVFVLFSLLAGLFPAAARTQDGFDPTQVEGIEASIYREYSVGGLRAIALGTPEPVSSLTIQVTVLDFDSADHARAYLDFLIEETSAFIEGTTEEEREIIIVAEPISTFGDDGYELRTSDVSEGEASNGQLLYVVDGEYVFVFIAEGDDEILFTISSDLMTYLTEVGEPAGEPEFSGQGGSTGGLWALFPASDDPLLGGMLNVADEVDFPVPAATEEG